MNINTLKEYIFSNNIAKKEYYFIKDFCEENKIEIIDFFKKGEAINRYSLSSFFNQAISKKIKDEKMISYFLSKQKEIAEVDFKKLISYQDMTLTYQHLFGLNKEEEFKLLIEENQASYQISKIFKFLKENPEFQNNNKIKELIIQDFSFIEKFEKANIEFNKESYNNIISNSYGVVNEKEHNPNLIKVDKFYEFIEKNKDKIKKEKREQYLKDIIKYGSLTVFDFTKESYWDYIFIPLIHRKEFPKLQKERDFFLDLVRFKEQIKEEKEPYGCLKIIKNLTSEERNKLVTDFITEYEVKEYNSLSRSIFYHYITEVNDNFISDFFKVGIESGYVFKDALKEEYAKPYDRHDEMKVINYFSKVMQNQIIKDNHVVIAKQILRHKNMFKENILKQFIPFNKDLVNEVEFILSLDKEEAGALVDWLYEENLPNTSKKILNIRLEQGLVKKGFIDKKMKI